MIDVSKTIAPKSDQLNSDDLIGGPRTIKITEVVKHDSDQQPIDLHFEGDNGKPYKPGLSMRRVLVQVWGNDGKNYIGRSMTIYRDDTVTFGGLDVGGIRISHMSDMPKGKPVTLVLTASNKSKKPFRILPLAVAPTELEYSITMPDGAVHVCPLARWFKGFEKGCKEAKDIDAFVAANIEAVTAINAAHPEAEARMNGIIQIAKDARNPINAG